MKVELWEFGNEPQYRPRRGVVCIVTLSSEAEAAPWIERIEARGHHWQLRTPSGVR